MRICVFEKRRKGYIRCERDNSIRTKGCPCVNFEPTIFARLFDKGKCELCEKNKRGANNDR